MVEAIGTPPERPKATLPFEFGICNLIHYPLSKAKLRLFRASFLIDPLASGLRCLPVYMLMAAKPLAHQFLTFNAARKSVLRPG